MELLIILFHIVLGIALFFIINWIGKHSFSVGYLQISIFLKDEDSPAFNVIFRILSPVVFMFIIAALLYKLNLDNLVKNIYFIPIYYLVFRLLFNLLTNRTLLMNWSRQVFYWISIISLSYYCYITFILKKTNLFPDFSTLSNELWIIIMIYLYAVFNKMKFSQKRTTNRKNRYLRNRYHLFYKKYATEINDSVKNEKLKTIIYAIMIYEDFNRPSIVRTIERVVHLISKKEHSLGIMQVKSNKLIDDETSVNLAIKKIVASHKLQNKIQREEDLKESEEKETRRSLLFEETGIIIPKSTFQNNDISDWKLMRAILKDYNPDNEYISEVSDLQSIISKNFGYNEKVTLWE
jgi:hypothetical protein